jgi:hypothetical protein
MSFRVTSPSRGHQAQIVAVERQMLSLHEVEEAGVAVVVVVMVADEVQVQAQVQAVVVGAATVVMHRIKHGKTKTRRDRRITIGNEGTTKR